MTRIRRKTLVTRERIRISSLGSNPDDVNGGFGFGGDNGKRFENHEISNNGSDGGGSRRKKRRTLGDNEAGDNVDRLKSDTCLVCDEEDNRLLVCCETGCPVALHEGCMAGEPDFDELGNFYCPYCWYKRLVIKSSMLQEKVRAAREAAKSGKTTVEVDVAVMVENGSGKPKNFEVNLSVGKSMSLNPCENRGEDGELRDECVESEKSRQKNTNETVVAEIREQEVSNDGKRTQMKDSKAGAGRKRRARGNDQKQGAELEEDVCQFDMAGGEKSQRQACLRKDDEIMNERENSFSKDEEMEPNVSLSISSPMSTNNVDEFNTAAQELPLVVRPDHPIVLQPIEARPSRYMAASSRKPSFQPSNQLRGNKGYQDKTVIVSNEHKQRNFIYNDGKRKRLFWTPEEEEMLGVGVEKFSAIANKNMPWRKILEFGRHVFHEGRTPTDLKDKWKNMNKSP